MRTHKNTVTMVDIFLDPEDLIELTKKNIMTKSLMIENKYSVETEVQINISLDLQND